MLKITVESIFLQNLILFIIAKFLNELDEQFLHLDGIIGELAAPGLGEVGQVRFKQIFIH